MKLAPIQLSIVRAVRSYNRPVTIRTVVRKIKHTKRQDYDGYWKHLFDNLVMFGFLEYRNGRYS